MLNEYVVLDLETTGLSRHRHKITEIAAITVKNNKIKREFQSLVNPEQHIPSFITRLTGISDEMVEDAPVIQDVLPDFKDFLGENVFVAHNATFDYGFLSHNIEVFQKQRLLNERLCTRKLASRLLPDIGSKKLSNLCEHFSIKNDDAHRAMSDVKATLQVFQNFHKILTDSGLKRKDDILRFECSPVHKCHNILSKNLI